MARGCGANAVARPQALQQAQRCSMLRTVYPRRHIAVKAVGTGPGAGMSPELKQSIDELITRNKIVVFMKGTKFFPQCGFSNTVVQILRRMNTEFETVDVLADEKIRSGMKAYSQWPTFPQVYIDGEFYGGCDIMIESYESGQLQELVEKLNSS